MPRQTVPAILGLSIFVLAAIAIAAYAVTASRLDPALFSAAVLVLAAGQAALIVVFVLKLSRHESWLAGQRRMLHQLSEMAEAARTRLDAAEEQLEQPQSARLEEIMADVRALRDSFKTLVRPKEQPAPAAQEPPPPQPRAANEQLELLLEPVIELASGTTAHYRALLDLTDDGGHVVRHADLIQKADSGGMRAALDAHMVKLVAPVLRRLRVKNPGLRTFLPVGMATLASRQETARILNTLEQEADVASGIIFEFQHRDLGLLDSTGIDNLAKLARLGATMALSEVQVAGLDLAALRQLGVRYLSFSPHAMDAGFGPTPAWREFVQYARAMQFQIVVSDIASAQHAGTATQIGRYGFGPFFAPPRKVRADAGMAASQRRAQAA